MSCNRSIVTSTDLTIDSVIVAHLRVHQTRWLLFNRIKQKVTHDTHLRTTQRVTNHAVRSGNKLVVRWCMQNGAVACPRRVDRGFSKVKSSNSEIESPANHSNMNVKSLIPDGASKLTVGTTLWECVIDYIIFRTFLRLANPRKCVRSFVFELVNFLLLSSFV